MKPPSEVLIEALTTEKATNMKEASNQYVFRVKRSANRIDIARAVEKVFKVKVRSVKTMVMHGKIKRLGRFEGRRSDWKKAVVRLTEGDTIDLFEKV